MQAIDKIKDRIKPQTTQILLMLAFIRLIALPYQRLVTSTCANNQFLHLSSFIMETMKPIS